MLKKKIKSIIEKTFKMLNKLSSTVFALVFLSSCLLQCSCIYVSGAFLNSTRREQISIEMSSIASANDNLIGFSIPDSGRADFYNQPAYTVYYWKTIFNVMSQGFEYVPTFNADKSKTVIAFNNQIKGLSFVYSDTQSFYCLKKNDIYRDGTFGFSLLDYGIRYAKDSYSFCYITESQARILLNNESPTKEDLTGLIGQKTKININENEYDFTIGNIIIEDDLFDKYHNLLGDFVYTTSKMPDILSKEATFLISKYPYINKAKLKFIGENIGNGFQISTTCNFNNNQGFDNLINSYYSENKPINEFWFVIFTIMSSVFTLCVMFFYYYIFKKRGLLYFCFSLLIPFIMYFCVYLIHMATSSIFLFSFYSNIFYSVFLLILLLTIIIYFFKRGEKHVERAIS